VPTPEVAAHPCPCAMTHGPGAYVPARHHILPQSWGGPTEPDNLIYICPNSHTAVHQLLNAYVHAGGEPAWSVLQHYNALVRDLAARAWVQRPSDHPPYTLAHPVT